MRLYQDFAALTGAPKQGDKNLQAISNRLSSLPISRHVPEKYREGHTFIFGGTGSGKTTLLKHLISNDLDKVARGEASVVVFESNRDFYFELSRLKRFAPGGDLTGRLITIDFEDVEYPVAISLFAKPDDRNFSPADREALYNSTMWMIEYVYHSLLDMELTPRMATMLQFCTNLLLATPGANIDSMIDLMEPKGLQKFRESIEHVDDDTSRYLLNQFDDPKDTFVSQTKQQITARLYAVKRINALARMLNATETKMNLADELSNGRVILINAPNSLLTEKGVEIIGRYFLALMVRAMHQRALLDRGNRLPTFVYMDEAQGVIGNDPNITTLLNQARKYRLSLIVAAQQASNLSEPVRNSLYANAGIRMARSTSDSDAHALARNMRCEPDFIQSQPPFTFATYIDGFTKQAMSYKPPVTNLGRLMSTAEGNAIREDMRRRYATPLSKTNRHSRPTPPPEPEKPATGKTKDKKKDRTEW